MMGWVRRRAQASRASGKGRWKKEWGMEVVNWVEMNDVVNGADCPFFPPLPTTALEQRAGFAFPTSCWLSVREMESSPASCSTPRPVMEIHLPHALFWLPE